MTSTPTHPNQPPRRAADDTASDAAVPRRPHGRLTIWLTLLALLLAASPAVLMDLTRPQVTDAQEAQTLVRSIETWRRLSAARPQPFGSFDALMPYYNGERQLDAPPGITWLHLLALAPLDDGASVRQIVGRARIVSYIMLLVVVAGVYWAGTTFGGQRTGVVAGLLCATNPCMIYHARLASTPIVFTAWVVLGIAAALWALRPLKPAPSVTRQAIGWAIAGIAIGAATFTLGAAGLAGIVLPVIVMILLCPNRTSHILGLFAAMLIGVLMVLPWIAHLQGIDPGITSRLITSLTAWSPTEMVRHSGDIHMRGGWLVLSLLPWTLWLVGALLQPFSTSSEGQRVRLFIGWSWFVLAAAVYLLLPVAMSGAALLVVVPAASIMLGQLFSQFVTLSESGRPARLWRLLRWPHVTVLAVLSVLLPLSFYGSVLMPQFTWPVAGDIAPRWPMAIGLGGALLTITALSLRHAARDFPSRAVVAWLLWALVVSTTLAIPFARGPMARQALFGDANKLAVVTGDVPIYHLSDDTGDLGGPGDPGVGLAPALLLYGRPIVPTVTSDQLEAVAHESAPFYLLAAEGRDPPEHGYARVAELTDAHLVVWRYDGRPDGERN